MKDELNAECGVRNAECGILEDEDEDEGEDRGIKDENAVIQVEMDTQ